MSKKMKTTMIRLLVLAMLALMMLSLTACQKRREISGDFYVSVTEEQKKEWYDALVKLISNEQGDIDDTQAPRPDEPSIARGYEMGLFDITCDGVPELFVNLGGGSAGNDYFYVYDIFSGEQIAIVEGGGDCAWNMYYDVENDCFEPIGRYDWRSGDAGSMHYVTTVEYDQKDKKYVEKQLFSAVYEYDKQMVFDELGRFAGFETEIEYAEYEMEGETANFQTYHYAMTDFYQQHSLVPHTGLVLFSRYEVMGDEEDPQARAEKMATALLNNSEQRFVDPN